MSEQTHTNVRTCDALLQTQPAGCTPATKFCGITSVTDANVVNSIAKKNVIGHRDDPSPAYVGLVFWPKSKRNVTSEEARSIRDALDPHIKIVGVFVDASPKVIAKLFADGSIQIAQLHGSEDESSISQLRELCPGLEIWKAFEVESESDIAAANASSADMVLLDGGKGEGRTFPHELLANMMRPYALAGGLSHANVAEVLDAISKQAASTPSPSVDPFIFPAIVDVSSGIEAAELDPMTGRPCKDPRAMQAFLQKVHAATYEKTEQPVQ